MIIVIIIALIILGYFGFDIQKIITSDTVHRNLTYVWDFVKTFWTNYLAAPVIFFWDKFVVGIVWKIFQNGLSHINV